MSDGWAKNSGKLTENSGVVSMTARAEAANRLRQIAGEPLHPVKAAIDRATRRVESFIPDYFRSRWHYGRAKDIWDRQARRIDAEEIDAIRAAADARLVREAKNEYRALTDRIARIEATLRIQDQGFYGPQIDGLRQSVGLPRREDSSVD